MRDTRFAVKTFLAPHPRSRTPALGEDLPETHTTPFPLSAARRTSPTPRPLRSTAPPVLSQMRCELLVPTSLKVISNDGVARAES